MTDATSYLTVRRHPLSGLLYGAAMGLGLAILLVSFGVTPFRWVTALLVLAAGACGGLAFALLLPASEKPTEPLEPARPLDIIPPIEVPQPPTPETASPSTVSVPPPGETDPDTSVSNTPFADIDPGRIGIEIVDEPRVRGRIDLEDPTTGIDDTPPAPPPPPAPAPAPAPTERDEPNPDDTNEIDLSDVLNPDPDDEVDYTGTLFDPEIHIDESAEPGADDRSQSDDPGGPWYESLDVQPPRPPDRG